MCGRYTLVKMNAITGLLPFLEGGIPVAGPRYNIAPSQQVAAVANDGNLRIEFFRWGLVPAWGKDVGIGNRMINARAESLAEKPAFRRAYRKMRCLVLADGFFEWQLQADGKTKVPMYITMKNGKPFCFAGLWEVCRHWGDVIKSCTIITTEANALMKPIHDRMPAIMPREAYLDWLDPAERDPISLRDWLRPYPAEEMMARPVSRLVNNPKHDAADVLAAAGNQSTLF
jgi:putative SOS response-associated peptidase YedK